MKNKMKEVAELLDLEIGKEFNIKGSVFNPCEFNENGLFDRYGNIINDTLYRLLLGNLEIEKLPKLQGRIKKENLKKDILYYYVDNLGVVIRSKYNCGNVNEYRINHVPMFYTQKDCEMYLAIQKDIRELSYDFSENEWLNNNIRKYYIYYNYVNKKVECDFNCRINYGCLHFYKNPIPELLKKYSHEELCEYYIKCVF